MVRDDAKLWKKCAQLEMTCPVPWQNLGDILRPRTCPGYVLKMSQDIYAKNVCGLKVI